MRNKTVAALLAFFLGVLGMHKFYLGRVGSGILWIAVSCTMVGLVITGLAGFVQSLMLLSMDESKFQAKYPTA